VRGFREKVYHLVFFLEAAVEVVKVEAKTGDATVGMLSKQFSIKSPMMRFNRWMALNSGQQSVSLLSPF
jgi:hypothetical protein